MEGMAFMERTVVPTAQKASRLHRGGSNAGAKVIHKRIPRLLSTMAAGSEYDKEKEKEATQTRIVWSLLESADKYSRLANVLESRTPLLRNKVEIASTDLV